MAEKKQGAAYCIPKNADVSKLIEDAKDVLYKDPNVIGVGIGERRKGDETHHDEIALIVYVKTKLPEGEVNKDHLIPPEFQGMKTDVVAPFGPDAPQEALGFTEGHQHSDDMSYVDWGTPSRTVDGRSWWRDCLARKGAGPGGRVHDRGRRYLGQDHQWPKGCKLAQGIQALSYDPP